VFHVFNVTAEMAIRVALENSNGGFRIARKRVNDIRYADDVVLIKTIRYQQNYNLKGLLNRIKITGMNGLVINKGKTNVMATEYDNTVITVNGDILQQVDHFQYLGAIITEDGRSDADVRTRLGMAKSVLTELEHIWNSRAITT